MASLVVGVGRRRSGRADSTAHRNLDRVDDHPFGQFSSVRTGSWVRTAGGRYDSCAHRRVASLVAKDEKNLWLEVLDCLVMLVPLVIPATTLLFLALHWHQMPSNSHGVFFLVFYGLVLGLMCTTNHWALRFRARSSDWAANPCASHKYRTYLGAMQALCFFIISCQMCGLAVMRLNGAVPWLRYLNMQTYFQVNYAALALGLAFAWSMRTWLTNHLAKESSDPMPNSCWKWGYFYFNPDDPAIVVRQRTGIGQSFNYARSSVWVLGGVVILLTTAGLLQSGG